LGRRLAGIARADLGRVARRGLPLDDVLPPFTSNVGRSAALAGQRPHRSRPRCDLVVLDDAHRVSDVMANGRWHVRDGAQVIRGVFEARG